jgi:hypothetical protein
VCHNGYCVDFRNSFYDPGKRVSRDHRKTSKSQLHQSHNPIDGHSIAGIALTTRMEKSPTISFQKIFPHPHFGQSHCIHIPKRVEILGSVVSQIAIHFHRFQPNLSGNGNESNPIHFKAWYWHSCL